MIVIANKWVRRFIYFDGGEPINPLFHLFMLSNLAWVVGVVFFADVTSIQNSSLFVALDALSPMIREWWGYVGLFLIFANTLTVIFRKPWLSKIVAVTGFWLWTYACMAYVLSGTWVLLFAVGVPHALFWVWYYTETLRYERLTKT